MLSVNQNRSAGIRGEKEALRYLIEGLHHTKAHILYDYHASFPSKHFIQIDFIVITEKFIILLEVKNIKGYISFQTNPPQLIRKLNDQLQSMDCPFIQLDRNLANFKRLLSDTSVPVYAAIVWTNRSAIIEKSTQSTSHPVLTLKQIPQYLQFLSLQSGKTIPIKSISNRLLQKSSPFIKTNLCENYHVSPNELTQGLLCLDCGEILLRIERSWICRQCKARNNHMVLSNVMNLFDVLKPELSFAEIKSVLPQITKDQFKSLVKTGLIEKIGKTNHMKYRLNRETYVEWVELRDGFEIVSSPRLRSLNKK